MSNQLALPARPTRIRVRSRLAEHQAAPPPPMAGRTAHGLPRKSAPRLRCWGCSGEELLAQGRALRVVGDQGGSRRTVEVVAWGLQRGNLRGIRPPGRCASASAASSTVGQPALQSRMPRGFAKFSGRSRPSSLFQLGGRPTPRPLHPSRGIGRRRRFCKRLKGSGLVEPGFGRDNPAKVLESRRTRR